MRRRNFFTRAVLGVAAFFERWEELVLFVLLATAVFCLGSAVKNQSARIEKLEAKVEQIFHDPFIERRKSP